jgi:hypothetical protein
MFSKIDKPMFSKDTSDGGTQLHNETPLLTQEI